MDQEVNHSRNSPLRDKLRHPIDSVVGLLDKLGVTADQVTITGLVGNILATTIVAKDNLKPREDRRLWIASSLILFLPKILDLLDGSLARKQGTSNPNLDAASDRISETIAGLAIMSSNPKARPSALAATLSTPLPSVLRAYQESQGKVVPESGKDVISFAGTYPGRSLLTSAALVFPEIAPPILTFQSLASAKTTLERITSTGPEELDSETTQKSLQRLKLLTGLTAVSAIAGLGLNSYLKKKSK